MTRAMPVAAHANGRFTLYNPSQGAVAQHSVAAQVLNVDASNMRVISGASGGGGAGRRSAPR